MTVMGLPSIFVGFSRQRGWRPTVAARRSPRRPMGRAGVRAPA
ncbi:phenolphthiocerol synthesis polyketide synthase type I Pks15/1 domain protein [Mycobacterium kansasii]|uniref:Phenolphthiocerol synthesis polyketide synthase type I Pks15/1 domain protein n=1 Tax=Mycobacterium kansasii TaxID=1768 RepID=A0A1V3Y007_MYCKA|nr:phenolphthiocerol synthesis polyketide synthase type I Pks15/1 domain protein [Mycobacterium kansasii]